MTSIRQSMSIPCAGGILPYRFWSSDKLTGSQTAGNVKFIRKNDRRSEPIMETMTDGRVYAFVGGGEIKSVVYFDGDNKRVKQIDVDAPHRPYFAGTHTHHGYYHNEGNSSKGASNPTSEERKPEEDGGIVWGSPPCRDASLAAMTIVMLR